MAVVREADPDRYLSALYAPEERRGDLFALYAFNAEIAAVRDHISEPLPGEIRLQWWRDALSAGSGQGNPLAEALLAAIDAYDLPVQALLDYLDARIFDLYDDPMPSRIDLEGYCGETASALIQLAGLVLDPQAAAGAATLSGHAGCAQAIAGFMRLMPLHRARGQCYVPGDILAAAGTSRDEFVSADPGEGGRRAVSAFAALGHEHLTAFEREAGNLPASLRPAFLPVALTGAYLSRASGGRLDPLRQVATLSAPRRHWLMFRRAANGWGRP